MCELNTSRSEAVELVSHSQQSGLTVLTSIRRTEACDRVVVKHGTSEGITTADSFDRSVGTKVDAIGDWRLRQAATGSTVSAQHRR